MSIVQEKMYMDVDDVCAILGVSKAYAYNLMRECKLCLNGMPVPLLRNCYSIFNGTKYR